VNSWKVILATIVIFGAGVITGGLLVNHVKQPFRRQPEHPMTWPYDVPRALRPEFLNNEFVERLTKELNLSKQQTKQIQKIISQGQQSTYDIWKLEGPQFQLVWRDTRIQIREVLTPEQRKEFEMLMKQQHASRRAPGSNAPPVVPAPSRTNSPATNGPGS
jgi:hypothetical protein